MQQNKRQRQIASEIKHKLGEYFIREGKTLTGDSLVSVARVEMSPDLQYANIYISIYPDTDEGEDIFEKIRENIKQIRMFVARNIRLRLAPEIRIFKDESMEYADRINKILRDLGE
ncbi:MAG: Ribosome-binding factor A [Marinimicrobia bacterium 46_43]|nr:MAG: Ribosome-binding factor A [Marinimicrobia bacterium 46_43]HBY17953.1 30S ribosome-binding factor RbfA [Candidatus Neomarinimicrobiota bacterium]